MNKINKLQSISFVIFCLALLMNSSAVFSQVLTYDFKNTLSESGGSAADLNALGTGNFQTDSLLGLSCIQRPVYHFNTNNGLQFDNNLSGNILSESYSIELYFKFDSDMGFRRILDFSNRTADSGLYATGGIIQYFDAITLNNTAFSGGQYGHLVLTRDSASQEVSIFVNGGFGTSFIDTGSIAILDSSNVLNLFRDDLVFPDEASSGNIALLKLYDLPLSAGEVSNKFNSLKGTLGVLAFNSSSTSQCEPGNSFTFVNTSDSTGVNISYSWNLGDGTLTTDSMPVHSYLSAGSYDVYLIASYANGCIDSSSITVEVFATPSTPVISQSGNTLSSTSAFSYQWYEVPGGAIAGASMQDYTPGQNGSFYVITADANGCFSDPSDTVNFVWSGINETELYEISLYPNPASDLVNFNIPSEFKQDLSIRIYDVIGNLIFSQSGATEIDIRAFMKGVYLVQIDTQYSSVTTKLIVDR